MTQISFSTNLDQPQEEKSSLVLGIIAGLLAAIIAGIVWAIITELTHFQIGWMAIGVGILVGFAVRFAGQGSSIAYGVTGAILALLGCLLGNFLAVLLLGADETISSMELLQYFLLNPADVFTIMKETFQPIDLLFYGFAMYEGFKFSISKAKKPPAQPQLVTQP